MDFGLFRTDHPPAALSFDSPHGSQGFRHAVSHPVAMRDLVETVGGSHRANLHWLEKDVKLVVCQVHEFTTPFLSFK